MKAPKVIKTENFIDEKCDLESFEAQYSNEMVRIGKSGSTVCHRLWQRIL